MPVPDRRPDLVATVTKPAVVLVGASAVKITWAGGDDLKNGGRPRIRVEVWAESGQHVSIDRQSARGDTTAN